MIELTTEKIFCQIFPVKNVFYCEIFSANLLQNIIIIADPGGGARQTGRGEDCGVVLDCGGRQ